MELAAQEACSAIFSFILTHDLVVYLILSHPEQATEEMLKLQHKVRF
jgi:hypothetical protein